MQVTIMNMQAVVEMSIICAIHGIINLETKTLRFVTKKQVQIFLFLRYNFLNFLEKYEKADTFSSKDGVQQEDEAEQNHSQLHVLQYLCTTLHQFDDSVCDRKQVCTYPKLDLSVCTCSPSTCKQTDEIEVCVLNWRYSFVCPSTDIDPSSIGCPDWSVSVCDNH